MTPWIAGIVPYFLVVIGCRLIPATHRKLPPSLAEIPIAAILV